MKMKQFEKLVRLNQKQLKKTLHKNLCEIYDEVYCEDGFVYAQGEVPILLVAHMDTVHKETVKQIVYEGNKISSPQGIGGDDRCGIAMVLDVVKHHKCSVLFTEDEENGGIGATKFIKSELGESLVSAFNFIIEFDRKGNDDAVFYDCANEDFEDFVTKKFFKTAGGSFSDISIIAPALEVAAVNLSCGYYNAHTTKEYVVWDEMLRVTQEAINLIDRADGTQYEYVDSYYKDDIWFDDYAYYNAIGGDDFGAISLWCISYEDRGMGGSAEVYANSEDEAVGKFLRYASKLTYEDILWIEKL